MSLFSKFYSNKLKSNSSVLEQPGLFSFGIPANTPEAAIDRRLRDVSGNVWRNSTTAEKDAVYDYTSNDYGHFNLPLRGYNETNAKFVGVGKANVSPRTKEDIDNLTNMISRSSYEFDLVIQRGYEPNRKDRVDKLFRTPIKNLREMPEEQLRDELLNRRIVEHGFSSATVSQGNGFANMSVIMNIKVPKGSQMLYTEPFSKFGNGAQRNWDGLSQQNSFSREMEVILQRDSSFRITGLRRDSGKLYFDMTLIGQNPREIQAGSETIWEKLSRKDG